MSRIHRLADKVFDMIFGRNRIFHSAFVKKFNIRKRIYDFEAREYLRYQIGALFIYFILLQ